MYDEFDVVIDENVAGSVDTAVNSFKVNIKKGMVETRKELAKNIKKHFAKAQGNPNEPGWALRKKIVSGSTRPLVLWGGLEKDVSEIEHNLDLIPTGEGYDLSVAKTFPRSKAYLYPLEKGPTGRKYAFVEPAINETGKDVYPTWDATMQSVPGIIDKGAGPVSHGGTLKGKPMLPGWAFWVLPTTSLFLYMGMYSDIRSGLAGSFLNPAAARSWVVAYFQGQALVTKKTIRRGFRRELWRR